MDLGIKNLGVPIVERSVSAHGKKEIPRCWTVKSY